MNPTRFILIFCCFILFVNKGITVMGQSVSLLKVENMWSVLEEDHNPPEFPDSHPYKLSYWLKTGNDTIVNGKKYVIILYSTDANHQIWENRELLMRETNDGKVYCYDKRDLREEESILYDFGMQEGDSIFNYIDRLTDHKIVSKVDSIRYIQIENKPLKLFYISNKSTASGSFYDQFKIPEIWIEGIGSFKGLKREWRNFFSYGPQLTWDLLCFYQNEKLLYHSPSFRDCYYRWVSGNPKIDSHLDCQVYPNPSSGKFTVQSGAENGSSQVQVFDMNGKWVRSYRLDDSGYLEVDLSNVSRGTYLVRLLKPGFSGTKKIVIN
jgi:hypothetical protein